ncbi:NADPH2:quinone reductase [Pseudarthrobacter sp. PvP004]|uniref:quinone oxidoreductase family protein n=1 Tax=Pseudarthrobacter sp. PvP004 TaxID=2817850 RepID=UPI001AE6C2D7|nr:quinone oxidoreductase [Pseudarthrobacter sp. PvP004]MBP2269188.1 NADPH2:quinone reductase [Pseudarthrobacter sp. PvP004]
MPHAIVATRVGGPEVLSYLKVPRPVPQRGQLLVRVAAAGINFRDIIERRGAREATYPYIPGTEASGTVVEAAEGAEEFKEGDRIATAESTGCYAEYALVDAERALPVPDDVDDVTAAALTFQGLTAHYLTNSSFAAAGHHTALVNTDGDELGLLLIQLLKAKGTRVITTAPTDQREALALQAGADQTLRRADFNTDVRNLTDGRGVDVVYDCIGKETFTESIASLTVRGTLVSFGQRSGPVPPVDLQGTIAAKSITLTVTSMASHLQNAVERRWRSSEVFTAAGSNALKVLVSTQYPLSDASRAHQELEEGRLQGKGILIP